jgi:cytosine/adenosine deaminase-related metal-dependent hydrolase
VASALRKGLSENRLALGVCGIRSRQRKRGGTDVADGLARSETPRCSPRLRDQGLQQIEDLFTAWHGKNQGRISVFPAANLTETSSPELLKAVRAFAESTISDTRFT